MCMNVELLLLHTKVSSFPLGLGTLISGIILLNCLAYPPPYLLYDE